MGNTNTASTRHDDTSQEKCASTSSSPPQRQYVECPVTEMSLYVDKHSLDEPAILVAIREMTSSTMPEMSIMLTTPIQVQLMRLLMRSINAKKCIEVGVFTGYNIVSTALALPKDGKVIGCDIAEKYVNMGKEIWHKQEGLDDMIDVRIGPASETLAALIAQNGECGSFDCCYIDADKPGYDDYYEKALQLVRPNGLVFIDNMIWSQRVLKEESEMEESTRCIVALTKKIKDDQRVDSVLVDICDGLLICRKI